MKKNCDNRFEMIHPVAKLIKTANHKTTSQNTIMTCIGRHIGTYAGHLRGSTLSRVHVINASASVGSHGGHTNGCGCRPAKAFRFMATCDDNKVIIRAFTKNETVCYVNELACENSGVSVTDEDVKPWNHTDTHQRSSHCRSSLAPCTPI